MTEHDKRRGDDATPEGDAPPPPTGDSGAGPEDGEAGGPGHHTDSGDAAPPPASGPGNGRAWKLTESLDTSELDEVALLAERHDLLATIGDEAVRRQAAFFTKLDERTHDAWLTSTQGGPDGTRQRESIGALTAVLGRRIRERARRFRPGGSGSVVDPLARTDDRWGVDSVSELLLGLAEDFGPRGSARQARGLGLALDSFACGDLRMVAPSGVVVCEPNSGLFLAFAEFAFLAHELGVDRAAWANLLRVMVRSQYFFVASYGHPELLPQELTRYRRWRREGVPGERMRDMLRRLHWPLDVPGLSAESSRLAHMAVL